jgi:oxygen-independent coproporphyrinogen-3 oxidase
MNDSPGIYVHIPFCRTKCAYCDFYSVTDLHGSSSSHGIARRFIDALETEASMYGNDFPGPTGSFYVGGGTPSALDPDLVSKLPGIVSRMPGLEAGAEVTIEVNPDDVTPAALEAYVEGGFNRISIGVQSFDDAELVFLGRRHDAAGGVAAVEASISSGFERVGLDLIFGMAGQTLDGWRKSLEKALEFKPEHISCYQLTVEPGTPLGERMRVGEEVSVGEEIQREMFLETSSVLSGGGYTHYEVSNFALGGENYSRHNMRYWLRRPYLGLGPSAHSFDGRVRRWNHRSLEQWLDAVEKGEKPTAGEEELSGEQIRAERLMLGFRTLLGVELDLLKEHPGWEETLEELLDISLVRIEGDRAIPTVEGYLVADQLPLLFM